MEPPNNGHSGDRPQRVLNVCYIQLVGGKQLVCSTEVVRLSECPLFGGSTLYSVIWYSN